MRTCKICLLINLFVCTSAVCQDKSGFYAKEKQILLGSSIDTFLQQTVSPFAYPGAQLSRLPLQILPKQFYYNSIGFFCRKELELEKSVKLPLKLRLGSLAYTDKMEGKGQLIIRENKKE